MTPATFVTYTPSGEIVSVLSCDEESGPRILAANSSLPYTRIVAPVDPAKHYAPGGVLTARPVSTTRIEGNTLKGVPKGATVVIEGKVYEADGSTISLEFEHAGVYQITVEAFPQQTWKGEFIEDQT